MTPDVDIETLRLLVHVDELGSLGAAARTLGISQPAASGRMSAFEARWRLSVIRRSPRGSELTEDGQAIVSWARAVLHEVDTMVTGLAALSGRRRTGVSIAASLTIAEFVLPRWLGELHVALPHVHPRLSVVNSEIVADMVRRADAEVGFIETAAVPVDLAARVVGADRLVVVVRPDHRWARRSIPVAREELAQEEFVLREPGSGTRSTFERALRHCPKVAMEVTSTRGLIEGALAGLGPTVVSPRAVAGELETGRLFAVGHELDLRRPLTAIWNRNVRLSEQSNELLRIAIRATKRP